MPTLIKDLERIDWEDGRKFQYSHYASAISTEVVHLVLLTGPSNMKITKFRVLGEASYLPWWYYVNTEITGGTEVTLLKANATSNRNSGSQLLLNPQIDAAGDLVVTGAVLGSPVADNRVKMDELIVDGDMGLPESTIHRFTFHNLSLVTRLIGIKISFTEMEDPHG